MARPRTTLSDELLADIKANKMTDRAIAEKHGVTVFLVGTNRQRLGIATAPNPRRIPVDELHLLGTQADSDLAERWGVNRQTVHMARTRAGIPRHVDENLGEMEAL